ncbi:flagellar basal body rod protein FlgB [Zafaria cholistanensis]|uniref:Flagellar basal body rod protein FlgB n=1 Tax=Zafaria cholistanensis TaxID=1682741 RepID=A0A5A7NM49_9MICC|nr:flagellar basal body protein [Zafaria cholistanensis]GER21639.1 flagellar basal body rod protein FlgB [Zafaria cholistanensis]
MFESLSISALTSALDGLSERQRAIANNIANVNTENYSARRILFEDALQASIERGDGRIETATEISREPARQNGNNVNLDTETLSNIDTVLRYQFAANAVSGSFSSVRTALRTH